MKNRSPEAGPQAVLVIECNDLRRRLMTKKQVLRKLVLSLVGILVVGGLFVGCGTSPSETTTPTATAPGPETITIRIGGPHTTQQAPWTFQLHDWFIPEAKARVEANTNYRLEFEELWGGTVAKMGEHLEAIETGILDMGYATAPLEVSRLPLHNFCYWLPFGPADPNVSYEAAQKVHDEFSELFTWLEEEANQKMIGFTTIISYDLYSTFPVNTLEDLEGTKMGGVPTLHFYAEAAGATPVSANIADMYLNLQSGVMDSEIILGTSAVGTKLYEVAPYWIVTKFFAPSSVHQITVNLDKWNELPPEIQDIFTELGREYSARNAELAVQSYVAAQESWEAAGGEIIELPRAELEKWAANIPGDYPKQQAKDANDKGLPGTEVVKAYIEYAEDEGYIPVREWTIE
jgi:TRAP-type C4-dicarboxylate transport system substrate-binding protein